MGRQALEVADIFRDHGPAWREINRGHLSRGQLKVMNAIEHCRTAALGGHVMRCENDACGYTAIAYNSCRDRHCPKCQSAAALEWLEARAAELLPVPYFHVVFTLPAPDRRYRLSEQGGDLRSLVQGGGRDDCSRSRPIPSISAPSIGITAVLHTWGSDPARRTLTHDAWHYHLLHFQ